MNGATILDMFWRSGYTKQVCKLSCFCTNEVYDSLEIEALQEFINALHSTQFLQTYSANR